MVIDDTSQSRGMRFMGLDEKTEMSKKKKYNKGFAVAASEKGTGQ
jgi:hypothetical protein